MKHAIVTTDTGARVYFHEADLAQIGGAVEVEVSLEVFETQTIVKIEKFSD